MGNPRGVKRDAAALAQLEERRLRAATLLRQGWTQADVAREVGVHRQSVSRWAQTLEHEGRRGLRRSARPGRKSGLSDTDLRSLEKALEQGPESVGYETQLWTLERVSQLIEQRFGIRYSTGHVWRILRGLGYSPQRPTRRALERDEEAIARWKRQRWPALKKTRDASGKRSSSSTRVD